jgi:hypothetical protein
LISKLRIHFFAKCGSSEYKGIKKINEKGKQVI